MIHNRSSLRNLVQVHLDCQYDLDLTALGLPSTGLPILVLPVLGGVSSESSCEFVTSSPRPLGPMLGPQAAVTLSLLPVLSV